MKVIVFEDESNTRDWLRDAINKCITENGLEFEVYLATGEEDRLRKTLDDLNETAVYFIDLVHNHLLIGLQIIFDIAERNKSDFIVIVTGYPEKVLFRRDIKVRVINIIFKRLTAKSGMFQL